MLFSRARRAPLGALPFLLLLVGHAAAACTACEPLNVFTDAATDIVLPADADFAACACEFFFSFATGPSPGSLRIESSPGLATVTVYDDVDGEDGEPTPVAHFDPADLIQGATVFSKTGLLRVVFTTADAPPAEPPAFSLSATAINQAPSLFQREESYFLFTVASFYLLCAWGEATPFPVQMRDYDNHDTGLDVLIDILTGDGLVPSIAVVVPSTPGVTFQEGEPDIPQRRVILSGPGSAVEAAIDNAYLVVFSLDVGADNVLWFEAYDNGHAATGEDVRATGFIYNTNGYPAGIINVPRDSGLLDGSWTWPLEGTDAVYFVHEAYQIDVTELDMFTSDEPETPCLNYIRVYDGPDAATGRLLSTDLAPTGEICALAGAFLPTYRGVTGEFVVEYVAAVGGTAAGAKFETDVQHTPEGFVAWLLDGNRVFEALPGGDPILLPQIMVTGLPDFGSVSVNISATSGVVQLRFADSFVDIAQASSAGTVSLALEDATRPVMLRVAEALALVEYMAPTGLDGTDTVTVAAWSGGEAAAVLEVVVDVSFVAINAPEALEIHAFQPTLVPVAVEGNGGSVTVSTSSGIGMLSADPRAARWMDVGYDVAVTVTDVSSLENLVYKASEGGEDLLTITADGATRTVAVTVDPSCSGAHLIYGRVGSITERAGNPSDRYATSQACSWQIYGAREMRMPYDDIHIYSEFAIQGITAEGGLDLLYHSIYPFPAGVIRYNHPAFYVIFNALSVTGGGFVATYKSIDGANDAPVIARVASQRVVRNSRTRLRYLYVDDFSDSAVTVSVETDAGSLNEEGTRFLTYTGATFADVDAWITAIDFLAGDEQTTATVIVTATDDLGASAQTSFTIDVLPCSGVVDVAVAADDAGASAVVSDGSGTADYTPDLECEWRLTGARAPAELSVEFLDMACGGDSVTVYEGSSQSGRLLGSFCRGSEVSETVGALVSETGSFYVVATSDSTEQDDGFSFVYRAVSAGSATELGVAPAEQDPVRSEATTVSIGASTVAVVGGWNGVRALSSGLLFSVGSGWRALAPLGSSTPPARRRAAGTSTGDGDVVVHGGIGSDNADLRDTWSGLVDASAGTISWTLLSQSGPATSDAGMHEHAETVLLVTAAEVWTLDTEWQLAGETPTALVGSSSAYSSADGRVYAVGADDGALWALDATTLEWTSVGVSLGAACSPWVCSGAMLGADEYVAITDEGSSERVNVTSLSRDTLETAASGTAVSGTYLGQPAMFVYGDGAMSAVALTLGVSSIAPQVSPTTGGTTVTVSGERLSSCAAAQCVFGDVQTAARIVSDRAAECVSTAGLAAGATALRVACGDGLQYKAAEPVMYFAEPVLGSVEPARPSAGDTVLIELTGVPDEVLAVAATPLCLFGESTIVIGQLIERDVRCRVPEDAARGSLVTMRVSLDGQQFGEGSTSVVIASSSGGGLGSDAIVIIACVAAFVLIVVGAVVARYRKLAMTRVQEGPAAWEIDFDSLELFEVIGTGGFGSVYRGQFRGGEVAIKVTRGDAVTDETIDAFRKESALMSELRHPNIVLFMGACTTPPNIAIVLEFLSNGSLFDLIHNEDVLLRAPERRAFALDIAKGMAYLHAADPPIIHRDLKSLNVLVDKSWTMKVSDFGLTEIFVVGDPKGKSKNQDKNKDKRDSVQTEETQQLGSVFWAAPEVLRGEPGEKPSDVYSFGVTLWEIWTRTVPYEGLPPANVAIRVAKDASFRPMSDMSIEPPYEGIIRDCWAADPARRPTFVEIQQMLVDASAETDSTALNSDTVLSLPNIPMGDSCVVVVQASGANALWAEDPARMRDMMGIFREVVDRSASQYHGHPTTEVPEVTICVFATMLSGITFASAVQNELHAREPELLASMGVAYGRVDRSTDPSTRRTRFGGPAVDMAVRLGEQSAGGQILVPRALAEDLDLQLLDLELRNISDELSALYPEPLVGRHEAITPTTKNAEIPWAIASGEIKLGELIGAGSFGTVFKATWRGAAVACKQLHRKRLGQKETMDLQMEGGLASKLRHPNIVQFLGVSRDVSAGKVYVVSELLVRGSAFDAIVTSSRAISSKIKTKVARDVAHGLRYLHEQSPAVVHRSLTARNILLGKDWSAKVSDFGLARIKTDNVTMTKVSSTAYTAPEILRGERYDERVDVYAFGIVLWELAAQEVALVSEGHEMRIGALVKGVLEGMRPNVSAELRETIGEEYVSVMEASWRGAAEERPSMREIGDRLSAVAK